MAYGTVNVGQAQNKDYIEESQKGKPNGVASLGPDGKVPEAQLPEMDVSQTLAQAELKDPPVDGDGVLVTDSAAGNATKRVLWSRIKAALKGYFDPLYAAKSHTHSKAQITDFPASLPANGGNAATVGGLSSDQLIAQADQILAREPDILSAVIGRSCEIKREVVENDPFEQGDRALLNFGHTLGHAIEKLKDFQMLHGECVSVGGSLAFLAAGQHFRSRL